MQGQPEGLTNQIRNEGMISLLYWAFLSVFNTFLGSENVIHCCILQGEKYLIESESEVHAPAALPSEETGADLIG